MLLRYSLGYHVGFDVLDGLLELCKGGPHALVAELIRFVVAKPLVRHGKKKKNDAAKRSESFRLQARCWYSNATINNGEGTKHVEMPKETRANGIIHHPRT